MSCELCPVRDERLRPSKKLIMFTLNSNDVFYGREACRKCIKHFFDHVKDNEYVLNHNAIQLVDDITTAIEEEMYNT